MSLKRGLAAIRSPGAAAIPDAKDIVRDGDEDEEEGGDDEPERHAVVIFFELHFLAVGAADGIFEDEFFALLAADGGHFIGDEVAFIGVFPVIVVIVAAGTTGGVPEGGVFEFVIIVEGAHGEILCCSRTVSGARRTTQYITQSGEDECDISAGGTGAHEADAPGFAFEGTEAAADFNVVVFEEAFAGGDVIDAIGNFDGVEHGEVVAFLGDVGNSHVVEAGAEEGVHVDVAGPAVFEAFFEDEGEGFLQAVEHIDGGGVVVEAFLPPVLADHVEVEVPGLDFGFSGGEFFDGFGGDGDGAEAGGTGEAFLGAGVGGIDAPCVDFKGGSAEGGDAVEEKESVSGFGGCADFVDGLMGAGGGFGVDEGDGFGFDAVDGVDDGLLIEDGSPGGFDFFDDGAAAFGDVDHASAEDAVDADEDFVAGFDEVDEEGFHAGGACAGDGEGHFVLGAEGLAEFGADVIHDVEEDGVEVADGGAGEGLEDADGDVGGAGAEEGALGGDGGGRGGGHGGAPCGRKELCGEEYSGEGGGRGMTKHA